jgi:hypothetical protein
LAQTEFGRVLLTPNARPAMQRSFRRAVLAAAILVAAVGCTRSMVQQNKQPPDPLLVSKKPVEGKPTSNSSGRVLTRVDPQPPALPADDPILNAAAPGGPVRLSSELVVRPTR